MKPKMMICPEAKTCKIQSDHKKQHSPINVISMKNQSVPCNTDIYYCPCGGSKCVPVEREKRWKPKHGEKYWYLVTLVRYDVGETRYDRSHRSGLKDIKTGNYFRTRKEAEAMLKQIVKMMREHK